MKVIGLDDREYNWPQPRDCKDKKLDNRSQLHSDALSLLENLFPTQLTLEEVTIPGSRLRIDIYIPLQRLAIEIHGSQHYTFSSFFHSNKLSFFQACGRDKRKKEWCNRNGVRLVELPYNMTTEWKDLILTCIGKPEGEKNEVS